jgi:MoaA/NifB/PqqE/SkfB family radical SAM enzyme
MKSLILSSIDRKPFKINFSITKKCNGRCLTCNIWKEKSKGNELSLEEIKLFFQNLPRSVTWLSLTGGEPFLRQDLSEILVLAEKHITNLSLISIPTNGLLQDKIIDVLSNFRSKPLYVSFSINGPEKIHDKITGKKGNYAKTWQTYLKALQLAKKQKNLKIGLEVNVSSYNLNALPEFLSALSKDKHKITITFSQCADYYSNKDETNILPNSGEKIDKIVKIMLNQNYYNLPESIIYANYLKYASHFIKTKKVPVRCVAGIKSFFVHTNGDISPCLVWNTLLGNLRDLNYDLTKIESKKLTKAREIIKEKKCPLCWIPCDAYQSLIMDTIKLR